MDGIVLIVRFAAYWTNSDKSNGVSKEQIRSQPSSNNLNLKLKYLLVILNIFEDLDVYTRNFEQYSLNWF